MDWKEQLDKKEKELNLTKGGNDVRIGCSDGGGIVSSNVSRSKVLHSECIKINKVNESAKGGSRMITVDGALGDLEALAKEATDVNARVIVNALKVVVKFLSTMRSNQLLTDADRINIRKAKETREVKEKK